MTVEKRGDRMSDEILKQSMKMHAQDMVRALRIIAAADKLAAHLRDSGRHFADRRLMELLHTYETTREPAPVPPPMETA